MNPNYPTESEALSIHKHNANRVGEGDVVIVTKGRKFKKGLVGIVTAIGRGRLYGGGSFAKVSVSVLVKLTGGDTSWINQDNLEVFEGLPAMERAILTVSAGKARAEFIKKGFYELDEVTTTDLVVMVSAQNMRYKEVAAHFMSTYNLTVVPFLAASQISAMDMES